MLCIPKIWKSSLKGKLLRNIQILCCIYKTTSHSKTERHVQKGNKAKNKNQLFQPLGQKTLSYIDVAQLHKTWELWRAQLTSGLALLTNLQGGPIKGCSFHILELKFECKYEHLRTALQMFTGIYRDSVGVFCNICRENPVIFTDCRGIAGKICKYYWVINLKLESLI